MIRYGGWCSPVSDRASNIESARPTVSVVDDEGPGCLYDGYYSR